jgi:uncharacterized protein YdeI (YjbR/CyaY-like superfamily)
MGRKDPRVDAYIDEAAPFAKPILRFLRAAVHNGCPDLEETIKWGMPHFDFKGPICGMAAFKEHCAFGFWKRALIFGNTNQEEEGMGQFGRITSLKDLPDKKTLIGHVRKAADLNEKGIKVRDRKKRKPLPVPAYLTAALKKNTKARTTFENFSPSHRRDYIEWLTEAKREETRKQRLRTALDWMAQGKPRNWKYM